jgi:hypothetical protein
MRRSLLSQSLQGIINVAVIHRVISYAQFVTRV